VWPSPITAAQAAAGRVRIDDLQLDGGDAYWIEGRPSEGGRCVIVRERDGAATDLIPAPYSARNWVHEYGGAAMRAYRGTVYFSNAADGRLYALETGGPAPITPAIAGLRYADFEVDEARGRLVCIVEDHRGPTVVNDIRAIPLSGGEPESLIAGNDFYSTPRISPDGRQLAWLTWNHPNMPWDGCELWVATLDASGVPQDARLVAGGAGESIFQPSWSASRCCTSRPIAPGGGTSAARLHRGSSRSLRWRRNAACRNGFLDSRRMRTAVTAGSCSGPAATVPGRSIVSRRRGTSPRWRRRTPPTEAT
jgi:hypothetical protein